MGEHHNDVTLLGDPENALPLIICFHGSGDSCASWVRLTGSLRRKYRVLLWNRGDENPRPEASVRQMSSYLNQEQLLPPYVLIAHSYGGTFAREFLQQRPKNIAGMVLVETGQETALDPEIEQQQYKKQVLGNKPLVVIRGNTLIEKWKQYEDAVAAAGNDSSNMSLMALKHLLDVTDREDERLKKAQLALSRNHRYIQAPDCGHGVVQQRAELVEEAVLWVMDNLQLKSDGGGWFQILSALLKGSKKKL